MGVESRFGTGSDLVDESPVLFDDLTFQGFQDRLATVDETPRIKKSTFGSKKIGFEKEFHARFPIVYQNTHIPFDVEVYEIWDSTHSLRSERYVFNIGDEDGYVELKLYIEYDESGAGLTDPVIRRQEVEGGSDLPKGIGVALMKKVGNFTQDIANQRNRRIRVVVTHRDTGREKDNLTDERWLKMFGPLIDERGFKPCEDPYGGRVSGLFFDKVFEPQGL